MKKIFINEICGQTIAVKGDEHKHLSVVLRAKPGDEIIVSDLNGYNYLCLIVKISKEETTLKIIEKINDFSEPDIDCDLYFGVLKGEHNDIIIQKTTELGVNKLVPLITKYTVAQSVKQDRLNKIALEAAKQCGRNKIPFIENVIDFNMLLPRLNDYDLIVFPYEKADSSHIKEFLVQNLTAKIKKIAIIIGPEGGFAGYEADALKKAGVRPITMGQRILRAETAAIAALTCVMYQSDNLKIQDAKPQTDSVQKGG